MNLKFIIITLIFISHQYGFSQEKKEVIFDLFTIKIPTKLNILSNNELEIKYSQIASQKPDIEYQDKESKISISYKRTDIPIREFQFNILKMNMEKQFSQIGQEVLQSEIKYINEKKMVYIKVSLEEELLIYNVVTSVNDKLVMIIISISESYSLYEETANDIINSIMLRPS